MSLFCLKCINSVFFQYAIPGLILCSYSFDIKIVQNALIQNISYDLDHDLVVSSLVHFHIDVETVYIYVETVYSYVWQFRRRKFNEIKRKKNSFTLIRPILRKAQGFIGRFFDRKNRVRELERKMAAKGSEVSELG